MRNWLIGLIVLLCTPAFAQQQPPVIAFDSMPDPLKLPDNLYLGEVSGIAVNSNGHIFVLSRGNTSGPAYAAAAAQLLEFDADGNYLREIGHQLYACGTCRHGVRAQTGSLRRGDGTTETSKTAPCRRAWTVSPSDRCRLRFSRQHLYQRRLHKLAHRESGQGRQLAQ